MRRSNCITVVLLYISICIGAERTDSRIIHFPSDRSMGMLYVLDSNRVDTSSYDDWEPLCEATGDVKVPAGKALRLDLSKDAGEDLSPLSALEPDDLQMLFCYGVEMVDDEFKHLSGLTGLQELYLRDTGILGTGLKHLARLNSLKRIRVDNTHVGDNELAYLSNLPSLESLNLWLTPTTDAGMVHVGTVASLEELVLGQGISDEGLGHLKGLTSLRWLSVGNRSISDDGLAHLAGLTQMEVLYIRNTQVSDAGLVYLENMKKLKMLSLIGTRVTEKGLIHLEGLENLENLELLFGVSDMGLRFLSKLPSLKSIMVDGESLSEEGLTLLSKFKSLEHVYIDDTDKMDIICGKLTKLSGLDRLTLGRGLTDEGLMQLKHIQSLRDLDIETAKISGRGIAALSELPSLQVLKLANMKLPTEEEWKALGRLSSLQRLSLKAIRSEVTDAYIEHLVGLQSMRNLSIDAIVIKDRNAMYSLDISDEGLGYLSKLKSLERLTLHGAKITDEGLQQLSEISTLKWMDLQGCNVTEQGLQRLKKKLPALRWYL